MLNYSQLEGGRGRAGPELPVKLQITKMHVCYSFCSCGGKTTTEEPEDVKITPDVQSVHNTHLSVREGSTHTVWFKQVQFISCLVFSVLFLSAFILFVAGSRWMKGSMKG